MADISTSTRDGQFEQTAQSLITQHIDIWTTAIEQKSSAGRGTSNKFSLYGIKKLRELILELAVRGKLVPQDPNDEPASVLLERIAADKAQLVKEGKLKKQKPLPQISEDEKPFELPNGWVWTCLEELTEINPRNSNFEDDKEASFVPMPLVSTSYKGDHGSETKFWKDIKKGYTHFADGDIGLAKITPCFENSKAAVFSGLVNGVGTGTTELHIARPIESTVDPLFILLYLKAPMFLKVGETKMTGTAGQKRVPKDFFAYNPLPFAPLEEQHRIVAKVDELMSLCDALEAQTEASISAHQTLVETLLNALLLPNTTQPEDSQSASTEPALIPSVAESFAQSWQRVAEHFDTLFTTEASIDTLKQTILQLAVMGKLVAQNPNDEPAAKLLKRIAKEKAQLIKDGKIKKQKPLPAISDEEKPFELPQGWEWVNLAELVTIRGGKRLPKGQILSREVTPYIYIRVSDMRSGSIREDDLHYISEDVQSQISNYIITSDDIYMTIVGATIGKCGLIPIRFNGMNLTENAARLTPFIGIDKHYLFKYLDSAFAQAQFFDKTKQVGVQKMALNRLSSTKVPFPPLEEQLRIIARVDELMALCDQLKARLSDAQTTQLHLTDAIVEQAI